MKRGTILKYGISFGLLLMFIMVAWMLMVSFYLLHSIGNANPAPPAYISNFSVTNPLPWFLFIFGFALILSSGVMSSRILKNVVGNTFTIYRTRGSHTGFCRYEGLSFRMQCSDPVSTGDTVKIVDRTLVWAGRTSAPVYIGKKVLPSDPDYKDPDHS